MRISLVYNYPIYGGEHDDYAFRFAMSYMQFPPGIDHETIVISNGGQVTPIMRNIIECEGNFPNLRWFERPNTAKDIGGYQAVTRHLEGELFVFFGGSVFFWKADWLKRVAESVDQFGETLYGAMAGGCVLSQAVYPHIRTTCFWTTPNVLNLYPLKAITNNDRYEFEHRKNCFTMWAMRNKFYPKVVTWSGIYDMKDWEKIPDGFHRSDQSGLLFKDRLTEEPFHTEKRTHEADSNILPLPVFPRTATKIPRGIIPNSKRADAPVAG